ncbi:hypothetical protein Tco_1541360 [Tanacetum coccineum]
MGDTLPLPLCSFSSDLRADRCTLRTGFRETRNQEACLAVPDSLSESLSVTLQEISSGVRFGFSPSSWMDPRHHEIDQVLVQLYGFALAYAAFLFSIFLLLASHA